MSKYKGVKNIFIREIPEEKMHLLNMLLENGISVEVEGENTFEWAIKTNNEEMVRQLIPSVNVRRDHSRYLRIAAGVANATIIKMLIDAGSDVTAYDNEAIINAAKSGNKAGVEVLLARGANPLAQNNMPILVAQQYGYTEICRLLTDFINGRRKF